MISFLWFWVLGVGWRWMVNPARLLSMLLHVMRYLRWVVNAVQQLRVDPAAFSFACFTHNVLQCVEAS
jgi:hypothetical protein